MKSRLTPLKRGCSSSRTRDANLPLPEAVTAQVISYVTSLSCTSRKVEYLKEQVMSKFVSNDTDPADCRRQRAINKWLSVERDNEATNDRLLVFSEDYNVLPRVTLGQFVTYARRLVADLIGETVPLEALYGAFSGGASTTRSRTRSHPALKYLGTAEITPAARKWFDLVLEESPLWMSYRDELVIQETRGNSLFTVPKSTTIDRCAAKEPDLNMYLQKGVGNYIRRRLRRVKINLNDQDVNKHLAREGSITDRLATIDLSSASDSVSIEFVRLLLPDLWFSLLNELRSPYTCIDGEWHENHMFSSMGNGFTFELESLLFWALAKTTCHFTRGSGVISVYGDDLIIGSDYAEDLSWVLGVFGFSVNKDKSFISGPFRESCGGHYHDGYDISPFYVRRPIATIRDAIIIANQIRRWSYIPLSGILDMELEELWLFLKSHIPSVLWGGDDLGSDSQLVSPDAPNKRLVSVSTRKPTGIGGYLLWLNACEASSVERRDAIVTSERMVATHTYVLRRCKAEWRRPPSIFLSELDLDNRGRSSTLST